MAACAQFASDLDPVTQRLLARGVRLTEWLKQGQYAPLTVEEQVVSIFAGVRGYLDEIEVNEVTRFEQGLLSEIRSNGEAILTSIRNEQELSDDTDKALTEFVDAYAKKFAWIWWAKLILGTNAVCQISKISKLELIVSNQRRR